MLGTPKRVKLRLRGGFVEWHAIGVYKKVNDYCVPFKKRHIRCSFTHFGLFRLEIGLTQIPMQLR